MSDAHLTNLKNEILEAQLEEQELIDLNHFIVDELKEARRRQARRTIHQLKPGGRAKVVGRLRGDAYLDQIGKVVKVNRTRVVMQFDNDLTTVTIPASVLAPTDE